MHGLSPIGKFIHFTKAARFWRDGNVSSFLWNWWNPLAWIFGPLIFVLSVLVQGYPQTMRDLAALGFVLSDYWKEHEREFY